MFARHTCSLSEAIVLRSHTWAQARAVTFLIPLWFTLLTHPRSQIESLLVDYMLKGIQEYQVCLPYVVVVVVQKGFWLFKFIRILKWPGEIPNFKWWRWLNGGKNQNLEKSQEQKLAPKKSHVEFSSLKNCQKALSDITWMRKILEMESLCLFMEQIS